MMNRLSLLLAVIVLLGACSSGPEYEVDAWASLIDPGFEQEKVVEYYTAKVAKFPEGSKAEIMLYAELQEALKDAGNNVAMDGKRVKLSGYMVPVETADDQVTRFLFFPTAAACIHVPASPANQTIYVTVRPGEGVLMEDAYEQITVYGTLRLQTTKIATGTASFVIDDARAQVTPRL